MDHERKDRQWSKFRARVHSRMWLTGYFIVIIGGVSALAWQALTSEGWTRIALLVLLGLMIVTYFKLIMIGVALRTQEQPPEWWYRDEGLAGRLQARRQRQ